jgi:hypothetical protein
MYRDIFVASPFSGMRVSRLCRHHGGRKYLLRSIGELIKNERQPRIGCLMGRVIEGLTAVQSLHELRQGHSNDLRVNRSWPI